MLSDLLPLTAVHSRWSSVLATQAAFPFTTTSSFTVAPPARIRFTGTSLTAAPAVLITGTLNAVPQTETVTVPTPAPSVALSTKVWSTVTQFSSGSTPTGTLRIEGVESSGNPVVNETILSAALPCRLRHRIVNQTQEEIGTVQEEQWICYSVRDGFLPFDQLVILGITYNIDNVVRQYDATKFHHSELYLRRQLV